MTETKDKLQEAKGKTKKAAPVTTYNLTAAERFGILQLMPTSEHWELVKIVNRINRRIGFDDDELEILNQHKLPEGGYELLDSDGEAYIENKDVKFSGFMTKIVVDKLTDLSEKKELPTQYTTLYYKFVLGIDPDEIDWFEDEDEIEAEK